MSYLLPPIIYLESSDFTSTRHGVTLKRFKDKTCIVMVQANWCGACTAAKPLFQQFALKKPRDTICMTIEEDGQDPDSERRIAIVTKLKPGFEGFPDYLVFEKGRLTDRQFQPSPL